MEGFLALVHRQVVGYVPLHVNLNFGFVGFDGGEWIALRVGITLVKNRFSFESVKLIDRE